MSVYEKGIATPLRQAEAHLYGSSRLGLMGELSVAPQKTTLASGYGDAWLSTFTRGERSFELSNRLGNVLAVLSDRKIAFASTTKSSLIGHYEAGVSECT